MIENRTCRIDTSFAQCGVCGDENDAGYGYTLHPKGYPPYVWACTECADIVKHALTMSQKQRSIYDYEARDFAGAKGGEYLESIGKTDLGLLEEKEWTRFLDTIFRAKSRKLRELLAPTCPPF